MARIPKWKQQQIERAETGKGYLHGKTKVEKEWRGDLLKDLPIKQYGRSYDDKLINWVQSQGGSERDANMFRQWLSMNSNGDLKANRENDERGLANDRWLKETKALRESKKRQEEQQFQKRISSATQNSFLDDILAPAKHFGRAINPTNDVSFSEAFSDAVDEAIETKRSPVNQELTRGLTRTGNAMTLNTLNEVFAATNDKRAPQFQKRDGAGSIADFAYDMLGYVGPGMVGYGGARLAGLGLKPGATGAAKYGQLATEGAIVGAGISGGEVGIRELLNSDDYTWKDNALHVGIGTAAGAALDPLLHGAGRLIARSPLGRRVAERVARGEQPEVIAREEGITPEGIDQIMSSLEGREINVGTAEGQSVVDSRVPRLGEPEVQSTRLLNGETHQPNGPLGLNEPKTIQRVRGLGQDVEIDGTPQLNAPNKNATTKANELDTILQSQDEVFKRRQVEEDAFVQERMKPFRDMQEQSANAEIAWKQDVAQAKETVNTIKQSYGKIIVPKSNWADWGNEIPPVFRAKKGETKGIDIYKFADDEGFSNVDEAIQFLKTIDSASKAKLKDLKPTDDMKITSDQYAELENAARLEFQNTDTAKGLDSFFNDLLGMQKQAEVDASNTTGSPLSFMQSKMFRTEQEPVSYVGRMNPKDQKAVRSETGFSTRYYESPSGDSLGITPDQPLQFKRTIPQEGMKRTSVRTESEATDNPADFIEELLNEAQAINRNPVEPSGNASPLGITPNASRGSEIRPIASRDNAISRILKGDKSLKGDIDKLKTQFSSDLQPFKDLERMAAQAENAREIVDILPDGSLTVKDSLFKGLTASKRSMNQAVHSIEQDYKPIINKVKQAGIKDTEFEDYLLAKHANDILSNNRDKVVRAGEIHNELEQTQQAILDTSTTPNELTALNKKEKDLIRELEDLTPYILPEEATPEWVSTTLAKWANNETMKQAQKDFVRMQNKDIDLLQRSGRFSSSEAYALKNGHPNYISMRRSKEDYDPIVRVGRARKFGSDEKIMPPIESAILNRITAIKTANDNLAKQKIVKLARIDGLEDVFKRINPETATENQMKNAIDFHVNGERVYYEIPQTLKESYDNLSVKASDDLVSAFFRAVGNTTKKLSTHYNTDFIVKSITRESQTPLLTSRTDMHPGELVLGFMDSFMGKNLEKLSGGKFKSYRDVYNEQGGSMTGYISMDYESAGKAVKSIEKGKFGSKWEIINPLKAIEKFGAAVENGPKLAEYRSAKMKGYSDEDAIHEAVDVFNYTDMGSTIRKWNDKIPYLNAAIRGNVRIIQAAKENPVQFTTKGISYITLPTLGAYALRFHPDVSEDQRSKLRNMPTWQRNMFWSIPIPGSEQIISIPKAHLTAQIFANPLERTLDKLFDDSNKSWGEVSKDTGLDTLKSLTPPHTMSVVSQLSGAVANYDWFMQMPVEDNAMKNLPPADRHNMYTSEVAKKVGESTNLSPARIDYAMKGVLGGVGRDGLDILDNLMAKDGSRPAKFDTIDQILNPFMTYKHDDTSSSGVTDRLYRQQEKEKWAGKKDTPTMEYYEKMKEINKEIREIRESTTTSSESKRRSIEYLRDQQRAIGDEVLKKGILQK